MFKFIITGMTFSPCPLYNSVSDLDPDPDGSGFFANPDPGFKSPDPSISKIMGSK